MQGIYSLTSGHKKPYSKIKLDHADSIQFILFDLIKFI